MAIAAIAMLNDRRVHGITHSKTLIVFEALGMMCVMIPRLRGYIITFLPTSNPQKENHPVTSIRHAMDFGCQASSFPGTSSLQARHASSHPAVPASPMGKSTGKYVTKAGP